LNALRAPECSALIPSTEAQPRQQRASEAVPGSLFGAEFFCDPTLNWADAGGSVASSIACGGGQGKVAFGQSLPLSDSETTAGESFSDGNASVDSPAPANGNSSRLFTAFRCRPLHHVPLRVLTEAHCPVCRSLDHTSANCVGRTEAASLDTRLTLVLRRFHLLMRASCDRSGCACKQRNERKNEFVHARRCPRARAYKK
jgi:hypothetical protein